MADFVYNIAMGAAAEKVRDYDPHLIVLVLEAAEADGTLRDHDDLSALLGATGNTEWTATGYSRKTGLSGTITVDDTNDRVDVDIPDQTWTGVTGSASTDAIVAHEANVATPTDADRVPLTNHDFAVTPDGSDVTIQFNSAGFYRAA